MKMILILMVQFKNQSSSFWFGEMDCEPSLILMIESVDFGKEFPQFGESVGFLVAS